jgi:hypothetical protein
MCDLKKVGWDFTTDTRDGDYVYKLTDAPKLPKKPVLYVKHPMTGRPITIEEYSTLFP